METMKKLEKIAAELSKIGGSTKTIARRRAELFESLCDKAGIKYEFVGDRPNGHSCKVVEMRGCYRMFIRCGYGKYNYAPCYEISK